jgi:esterase/lipase superfamily enzyme
MYRSSKTNFSVTIRLAALCTGLLFLLAGCGTRPDAGALAISSLQAPGAVTHDILVVSTRERDDRPDTYFNGERGKKIDFAEASISVPPLHKPGNIEWPSVLPGDPKKDFVPRQAGFIDGSTAFASRLNQRLSTLPRGQRTVFLFIHGYNTRFPESLYRFTQLVHDADFSGVPVLFTWASRGKLQDYVYDLNSAAIARDGLEKTIRLIDNSKAERVVILAHSMGNWLMMETARQIPPSERKRLARKVERVFLAAPDIDIDVFKSQLKRIGHQSKPYVILVSHDDRALRLSKTIAGGKERVGAYQNDEELAQLGAIVIDLTDVTATDAAHHSKFSQVAEFSPEVRKILSQPGVMEGAAGRESQLGAAGNDLGSFISSTAKVVVTLPVAVVTAPINLATGNP